MNKKIIIVICLLLAILIPFLIYKNKSTYKDEIYDILNVKESKKPTFYIFYYSWCPIYKEESEELELLKKEYNFDIKTYDLSIKENYDYIEKINKKFNKTEISSPITIIGDNYYIGFSKEYVLEDFKKILNSY